MEMEETHKRKKCGKLVFKKNSDRVSPLQTGLLEERERISWESMAKNKVKFWEKITYIYSKELKDREKEEQGRRWDMEEDVADG